jgi:uncharacterized protein YbaR (Trm112 family)
MKRTTFDILACPTCHERLESYCADPNAELCLTGNLSCKTCCVNYSIVNGIPHFIKAETLNGFNRRFIAGNLPCSCWPG